MQRKFCAFFLVFIYRRLQFTCVLFVIHVLSVSEDYFITENATVWQVVLTFILSACFSVRLCVWQSVKSDHYLWRQITGEQRSPTAPRPCVKPTAVVQLCPCDGLEKLWWDPSQQRDVALSMPSAHVSQKVWFHFFLLVWSVRFKRNERHTRSCSDYKATKHETGAESVSVPAT